LSKALNTDEDDNDDKNPNFVPNYNYIPILISCVTIFQTLDETKSDHGRGEGSGSPLATSFLFLSI
jgi:lipoprotein